MFTQNANKIFAQAIDDYHRYDDVDHQLSNPYAEGTIDHLLYMKNCGYGAVAPGRHYP